MCMYICTPKNVYYNNIFKRYLRSNIGTSLYCTGLFNKICYKKIFKKNGKMRFPSSRLGIHIIMAIFFLMNGRNERSTYACAVLTSCPFTHTGAYNIIMLYYIPQWPAGYREYAWNDSNNRFIASTTVEDYLDDMIL